VAGFANTPSGAKALVEPDDKEWFRAEGGSTEVAERGSISLLAGLAVPAGLLLRRSQR
jgi:hypothetical protein